MQDEFRNRPLRQNDIVSLHGEVLKELKKQDPKKYAKVTSVQSDMKPIRDNLYLVLEDEKDKSVFLVGRKLGSSSDKDLVKTSDPVPVEFLYYWEPEGDDEFTSSERKDYGLE